MEITFLSLLAFAALLGWVWLAVFRGGFWLYDERLGREATLEAWPEIVAVIPARDEAATIGRSIGSLIEQDYPGKLTVIVVDDESRDGTAEIALQASGAGQIEVISGAPLESGWAGKVWAMRQGIARAGELAPDARYVLLTDADIDHGADSLRRLVAKAETELLDLVSLMVRLRSDRFWERWLIPAFVFFFQKLYPFAWVSRGRVAAAAGGCMLVRRTALERIGGIEAIRDRVIDDCALAAAIAKGGKIWLGLAETSRSIRGYDGLSGLWNMVARTAFVQLNHSLLLLAGTVMGMAFLYLVPPAALVAGGLTGDRGAMAFGAAGWALMAALYLPILQYSAVGAWRAVLLPLVAVLYSAMTVSSAFRHYRGRGAAWKGRSYSAPPRDNGNGT